MSADQPSSDLLHAKRYMLSWLSDVCADAREDAGLSLEEVAAKGGVSYSKIYKFEELADRWPRGFDGIDKLLAAYAAALGIRDHRELWVRAISRWMQEHHRAVALEGGELAEAPDGEIPPGALQAMEEAVEAYVRERDEAAPRSGQVSRGTAKRAASGTRGRA